MNNFHYDIEIIVTWKATTPNISFVHRLRGINLEELYKILVRYNITPKEFNEITINIRGVNY